MTSSLEDGSPEHPYTHRAPGRDIGYKHVRCSECKSVHPCTPSFDFFVRAILGELVADESQPLLVCQGCMLARPTAGSMPATLRVEICEPEEGNLMEPAFVRPDVLMSLGWHERAGRVRESDDVCMLVPPGVPLPDPGMPVQREGHRYFLRTVMDVQVTDRREPTGWGVWVEIAAQDLSEVLAAWEDPQQHQHPAIPCTLANAIPGYAESTLGLPCELRLVDASTRPASQFSSVLSDDRHPFVKECREGVTTERVEAWLWSMVSSGGSS